VAARQSRRATGVTARALREQFVPQRSNGKAPDQGPMGPGPVPGWAWSTRQCGMLSSRPIGFARSTPLILPVGPVGPVGPTSLYTVFPRPRALQGQVLLICATRPAFSICTSCQPCSKWTKRDEACRPAPCLLPPPLLTTCPGSALVAERSQRRKHLRTMKEPVARTASPYTDPAVKGPRSQQLHSSSGISPQARKSKSPPPSSELSDGGGTTANLLPSAR